MEGWIKVHRQILDNPVVCKDSDYFAIWIYLLLEATHAERKVVFGGEKITLKAGQLITGRKAIASKLSINESKVYRVLNAFKSEQQIEQRTDRQHSLISIVNWELYQNNEQRFEHQMNNDRTTSEQRVNTNKNERIKECKNDYSSKPKQERPKDWKPYAVLVEEERLRKKGMIP